MARMNPALGFELAHLPRIAELPSFMGEILKRAKLGTEEAYHTFNMGVGMVVACDPQRVQEVMTDLKEAGENVWVLGQTTASVKGIILDVEGQKIPLASVKVSSD